MPHQKSTRNYVRFVRISLAGSEILCGALQKQVPREKPLAGQASSVPQPNGQRAVHAQGLLGRRRAAAHHHHFTKNYTTSQRHCHVQIILLKLGSKFMSVLSTSNLNDLC